MSWSNDITKEKERSAFSNPIILQVEKSRDPEKSPTKTQSNNFYLPGNGLNTPIVTTNSHNTPNEAGKSKIPIIQIKKVRHRMVK